MTGEEEARNDKGGGVTNHMKGHNFLTVQCLEWMLIRK